MGEPGQDLAVWDDVRYCPGHQRGTSQAPASLRATRSPRCTASSASKREPAQRHTMMSDALLAQFALDLLTAGAHTLIIDGPFYRQRNRTKQHAGDSRKPGPRCWLPPPSGPMLVAARWSRHAGKREGVILSGSCRRHQGAVADREQPAEALMATTAARECQPAGPRAGAKAHIRGRTDWARAPQLAGRRLDAQRGRPLSRSALIRTCFRLTSYECDGVM